jgi:hypothetical protein
MEAVPAAIYSIGKEAGWSWSNDALLVTPVTSLGAANNWFFGHALAPESYPIGVGSGTYLVASFVGVLIFVAVLMLRYRRIAK